MNKFRELNSTLVEVETAMGKLHTLWEDEELEDILNNTGEYPFDKDFGEIHLDFHDFRLKVEDDIETYLTKKEDFPVTYALIRHTVGWSKFAEVTSKNVYAVKEYGHFQDHEIFKITLEQAKTLKFI